jgi:hypothetical protein
LLKVVAAVMSGSAKATPLTGKESLGGRSLSYHPSLNYQFCHLMTGMNLKHLLYLSRMMIPNLFTFMAHLILN